jgi:hypothetical protein
LKPENVKDLQAILLYHVSPKKLELSDLRACDKINGGCPTLNGSKTLSIKVQSASSVFVNEIQVGSSFQSTNGIIRTIPSVLLPPAGPEAPVELLAASVNSAGESVQTTQADNTVAIVSAVSSVAGLLVLAAVAVAVRRSKMAQDKKPTASADEVDRSLMSV